MTASGPFGPLGLEDLVAFVNTRDLPSGTDALAGSGRANRWLRARRLIPPDGPLDEADVRRTRRARELLRNLVAATPASRPDEGELEALDRTAARVRFGIRLGAGGRPEVQVLARGVDAVIGRLLMVVLAAWVEGSWSRVKICRNPECRRVFFDTSRNRSRAWCDMATCGNRAKARAFRRRRAV